MIAAEFFTQTTIRFAVFGMATGSLFALVALAVNLVYRCSGVLNFAASALGGISSYLFYDLRDEHGWPWLPTLVLALLMGAVLGAFTYVVLMRVLQRASPLTKLIATLGLFTAAVGFVNLVWSSNRGQVRSILPTTLVRFTDQIVLTQERLIIIAVTVVLAIGLRLLNKWTFFGLASSAVAESPRVAAAAGISPGRVQVANFAIGGLLSALSAILLAPIIGLNESNIALMTVGALAAALVGRFSSFALTVAAAMLIGIMQAELSFFQPDIARLLGTEPNALVGLPSNVPFLIVIVMTVVGGSARPPRSAISARLPRPGYGRVRWPLLVLAVAVTVPVLLRAEIGWATVLTLTFVSAIILTSVVVVTGFGGQLSLCQYSFAGFGAWMTARLIVRHGLGLEVALLLGVACTSALGALIALPSLRTRGVNLAVVTIGLALMLESIVFNSSLLGGIGGPFRLPTLLGVDINPLDHPGRYCATTLLAFVLIGLAVANLRRSASGRRLLAVRSNERAAASLGVGIYSAKVYAFSLAAAIAAVGGVLLVFRNPKLGFGGLGAFSSISVVLYAVLGGIGWTSGALIGATLSPGALNTKLLNDYVPGVGDIASWLLLASGILVIVTLNRSPDGFAALLSRRVGSLLDRARPRRNEAVLTPIERPRPQPATVTARNITVRFGGVVALDDATIVIEPGQIIGLIGPNGAGKTTLLDVLSGFTRPTSGSVVMNERPIDRWTPERRARAGMVRSWQQVELFEEMSVRENLLVAADSKRFHRYFVDLVRPGRRHETATMREVVGDLDLGAVMHLHPSSLPHGVVRLVGIARAVTAEPAVLLLDEPAAGLSDIESHELGLTITRIAQRLGIPILITEHDVPLLMAICDRLIVLDFGRVIAEGTPDEIGRNPDVVRAYLGEPVAVA